MILTQAKLNRILQHYFFACYLLVLIMLFPYLKETESVDLRSTVFTALVYFTYGLIYILPAWFITRLLLWLTGVGRRNAAYSVRRTRLVYAVAVMTVAFTLTLLYTDYVIYSIYGFHINGFVWNLVSTPGGIESMGGSNSSYWTFSGYTLGFFLLPWAALLMVRRIYMRLVSNPATKPRKLYRYLLIIFLLATFGERVTYGISNIQGHAPVLSNANVFPLYQPATFRSLAKKLGYKVNKRRHIKLGGRLASLSYPLKPIRLKPPGRKPLNIVWLVAESWRADMLTPEIMPATYAFAQQAHNYTNHYSGSNMTRMGVFTMFYGLYGTYWFPFLDRQQGPVLLDVLKKQGYQYGIYSSARLTYPEFNKTVFVNVPSANQHEFISGMGWERDRHNVKELIDFIDKRDKSRPFMTFMFFESPHANYYFPDESVIRKEYLQDFNYATSINKKYMPLIKNRYINSVRHLDSQFARILEYLRREGLDQSTIVLITGDHGEEFMEKGRWGHGSEFHEEQIHVPLVLSIPGTGAGVDTRLSSHMDIPATLMPYLGVTNPPQDYSLGYNLMEPAARDFAVVADWNHIGYIGTDFKAVLPMKTAGLVDEKVMTHDDKHVSDDKGFFDSHQAEMLVMLRGAGVFGRLKQ